MRVKGDFEGEYKRRALSIILGLKRNSELQDKLLSGDLTAEAFIAMEPREMATKEARDHRAQVEQQAFEAYGRLEGLGAGPTGSTRG